MRLVLAMTLMMFGAAVVGGKPAVAQAGAASRASGGTSDAASGPVQSGIQILSDAQGVDFSGYLQRVHSDVMHNWQPLIPKEVQAPMLKKGIVGIRFTIRPDGAIGSMKLETPSGDVALDKAAWFAITAEGTFPPLPKEFKGPQLELRVGFFYNEGAPTQGNQAAAAR